MSAHPQLLRGDIRVTETVARAYLLRSGPPTRWDWARPQARRAADVTNLRRRRPTLKPAI
jgi:hypothetical protein